MSQLLAPLERTFQPVVRRQDQGVWKDPVHDFKRRSLSPSNGHLKLELIEGTLGAHQHIAYNAPAVPGQEHHLYVLSGEISIKVEGQAYSLKAGDCLRYQLNGETEFQASEQPCQYVIALL